MGRYSYSYRDRADGLRQISIFWLKKHNYIGRYHAFAAGGITWTNSYSEEKNDISLSITRTSSGTKEMKIYYTITDRYTGEKRKIDYKVQLVTTPCHFGGIRYWFICPFSRGGVYCGGRVAKLYMGGDYFACRHCYNLTYESRFVNKRDRLLDKIFKADRLYEGIKRPYYNGKPTRKMKRIMKLNNMAYPYYKDFTLAKI